MASFYRDNIRFLAAGFLLAFGSSFGQTFFISVFAAEWRADFGLSHGDFGALYMIATLGSALVLSQIGVLADVMAVRRLAFFVLLAFAAVCLWVMQSASVWALGLAIFGLRLCGQGMMSHLSLTTMGRWFGRTRGKAVAAASLGYPLGEALLPPLFVALIIALGWRGAWGVVLAILLLALGPVLLWLLSRERAPRQAASGETGVPGRGGRHWNRAEVLRDPFVYALLSVILAPAFIGTAIFFQMTHIVEVKGWSLAAITAAYPAYALASVLAGLASGAIIDRIGAVRLVPVELLPMALALLVLGLEQAFWSGPLALALLGISSGIGASMVGAIWAELYGTRHLGGVRAMAHGAMVLFSALGPGATGIMIDFGIGIEAQFIACAIYCFAASLWAWGLVRREALA